MILNMKFGRIAVICKILKVSRNLWHDLILTALKFRRILKLFIFRTGTGNFVISALSDVRTPNYNWHSVQFLRPQESYGPPSLQSSDLTEEVVLIKLKSVKFKQNIFSD